MSIHRLRKAGDQVNNLYLEHEEDLSFAELELTSINDTIQHLLKLKIEKENTKSLLENAVQHDKSIVDENGKEINNSNVLEEIMDNDNDIKCTENHHINSLTIEKCEITAYEILTPTSKILWC